MIRNSLLEILNETWPAIFICGIVIISLRITFLIKNKQKLVLYKELLDLTFIAYILCLFYVVTFEDVSFGSSNFIPFKEIFRYQIGSRLFIKNILGNIFMFIPYGYMIGYYLKLEKPDLAIILTFILSLSIESVQLVIGRVFDIDDILLNLVGGLVGAYIYTLLKSLTPGVLKKEWFYNIIVVIVLLLFALYLFNFINLGV